MDSGFREVNLMQEKFGKNEKTEPRTRRKKKLLKSYLQKISHSSFFLQFLLLPSLSTFLYFLYVLTVALCFNSLHVDRFEITSTSFVIFQER